MKCILFAGTAGLLIVGSVQAGSVAITTGVDHPHHVVVPDDPDSGSTTIIKKHRDPDKKVVIIKKKQHHDDDGTVASRRGRNDTHFLGCNQYPACDHTQVLKSRGGKTGWHPA